MLDSAENKKTYKIAILVSIASVLQICESFIPHPIPGLRLGLANMLTLVALVTLGFRAALEIAILRTILSAFVMGTFMSPTFIFSFLAAVVSSLVMGMLYWISGFPGRYRLSLIGISILGALSHNMVQLCLAYLFLVKHRGIFVFTPWLCIGAVVMGLITGVVARRVCIRLKEGAKPDTNAESNREEFYAPGSDSLRGRDVLSVSLDGRDQDFCFADLVPAAISSFRIFGSASGCFFSSWLFWYFQEPPWVSFSPRLGSIGSSC